MAVVDEFSPLGCAYPSGRLSTDEIEGPFAMSSGDPWTIGRLLAWTTDYLKSHGSDSPRLDAEVLLAESLGVQRIELYMNVDQSPSEAQRSTFRELVRRRAAHEPVAYLVGHKEFYSLDFEVTRDVLIPRPETELLVVAVTDMVRQRRAASPGQKAGEEMSSDAPPLPEEGPPEIVRICDVGTGSGAIAVSLAKHVPASRVTAVDICPQALAVAKRNAERHGVLDRMTLIQGDLLSSLPPGERFDYIASNPPYVTEAEMRTLPTDVRGHEPWGALCGGPRGIEVIERLVPQAIQRLQSGGWLLMEIGPAIHEAVLQIVEQSPGLAPAPTIKDLAGHPRVVRAQRAAS